KDTTYAEKAKEALLNLDIADIPYKTSKAWGVLGYSLCYDWVQPYLDSASDEIIRDKLAILADEVYYDLNDGGTNPHYIAFHDYHARAYPAMGIVGCVLSDYTNPNNISLNSTPSDWYRVGTDYLFENDLLHDWNRSLLAMQYDSEGGESSGEGYKSYEIDEFMWWFQVYSHFTGRNIFDDYPMAKKIMVAELWESLPNRYHINFATAGQYRIAWHRGIMNLLDNNYKSYLLNHDDIISSSNILPYVPIVREANNRLLYLVYDDYSSIPRRNPEWTSHFSLEPDALLQIFRGSWQNDSDWLSLITWPEGFETGSNRNMAHHDQLSFEYYSRGDLLLADGGETKHILDYKDDVGVMYGMYGVYHNSILIEDPRTPFTTSSWADSQARGIFKGKAIGLFTPAYIRNLINTTWMELVDANVTIEKVIGESWFYSQAISSPINYERAILYPEKDYFAIIDRLEGSEPWVYRN
ncbi:heparinase II/III family protein, partial [bacterium]|nr:heparinase II/III family protein [bacterium]